MTAGKIFSGIFEWNGNVSRFPGFTPEEGSKNTTMAHPRSLPLCLLAGALLCPAAAIAQQTAPGARIVDRIDESRLVTLKGNTHPYANAQNDRGRVSPTLPMTDLILVLSRSSQQQAAFDLFVASQYDPGSPNYHHWLEPEDVGANFGPSPADIATISNWLTGQGFSVNEVTKDRMTIRFSGTAGQVENAFHTEMHNLEVKGEAHIGNMSDPQIPAALAPAVVGVKALHNFFAKPLHHLGGQVTRDSETGKWKRVASAQAAGSPLGSATRPQAARPQFTINDPNNGLIEDVAPYDFASIYNVTPLWNAGIDGTGQTIAIAGTSSVNLTDISNFRTVFGLPTSGAANTPRLVSGNSSPLTICTDQTGKVPYAGNSCELGDLVENSVDVEWSGAVAKNAQIVLVSSYPTSATDDGLYDSESYIVNHTPLTAHIMNVSYGLCELFMGPAGNQAYNSLWQTAASEGIAVFVASGDSGSAGCDDGLDSSVPYSARYGLSVSGFASTPYNTAVGGTDFNWCKPVVAGNGSITGCSTGAPYWNTTNSTTTGASAAGYVPEVPWNDDCASPPSIAYLASVASFVGVSGVRDAETACNFVATYYISIYRIYGVNLSGFIDIVGGSGGASSCTTSDGSTVASCSGGYAKPSWQTGVAGIPADGKRDIPDVSFFAASGTWNSAYLMCVSEAGSACVSSTTITTEPVYQEIGGTSLASPAMAGVMALINQKANAAQGNPNAQLYALAARQTYSSCSAESVTAGSASCYFNDIDTSTIAVPCLGGSPNCTVLYTGDVVGILSGYSATTGYDRATGLGSLNVANVVNAWTVINGTATATVTVTPAQNSLISNTALIVTGTVTGTSGTPTGTVTLSGGGYLSAAQTLTSSGGYSFTIPAYSLTGGTVTLTASYSGDAVYAAATGSKTVQVTQSTYTVTATTPAAIASPGGSTTSTVTVAAVNGYAGTVTLTCALTTSPSGATYLPSCSIPSTAVAIGGTATATITTTAASAALVYPKMPGKGRGWAGAGGGAVLALLVFLGIPARRRSWRQMMGVLALMAALGSLAACGGGNSVSGGGGGGGISGTTLGSYTFTVTGTGSPAVSPIPSTTFTVTVN